MQQVYGKSERAERLIQYAIEIFDLVEIAPAAGTGRSIRRQLSPADILPAVRYGEIQQSLALCTGLAYTGEQC